MKILIFYTFNYYEKYQYQTDILNLSLYSVYKELVNKNPNIIIEVAIYTENDIVLKEKVLFPCKLIKITREQYANTGIKFTDKKIYNSFLDKFSFIGHSRIPILMELLLEGKYDKYVYLDNDVVVFRDHGSEILTALLSCQETMGCALELIKIKEWFGFLFNDNDTANKDIKVSHKLKLVDDNELSKYNDCNVINNGIIIATNKVSVPFMEKMIKIYCKLIDIYDYSWGHDQTAFTITCHIFNYQNKTVRNDADLKYIFHYVFEKYCKPNELREYIKCISLLFDNNQDNRKNYLFEKNEIDYKIYKNSNGVNNTNDPGKVINNVISQSIIILSNPNTNKYYFYPYFDFITFDNNEEYNEMKYTLTPNDTLSVNTQGVYKEHNSYGKLFKLYDVPERGIYINHQQLYKNLSPKINKIIFQVYPSIHTPINEKLKNYCLKNNWDYRVFYLDKSRQIYHLNASADIIESNLRKKFVKSKDVFEKIMITAYFLLYTIGGVYIDNQSNINEDMFNENILKHNFISIFDNNYVNSNNKLIGSIKGNDALSVLVNANWSKHNLVDYFNHLGKSGPEEIWIYPANLII